MELKDKVALVTGGSGGIGKGLAKALLAANAKVMLTDRDPQKLEAARTELGEGAFTVVADVTKPGAEDTLISGTLARCGRLDVVLNNAGMMVVGGFEQIDVAKVTAMVHVNVDAAFRIGFAALRHFKSAGSGYLINTSSVAGVKSGPNTGAYAGTKAAIESFTEGLRLEVANTDIGVSCIEPGTVDTGLFDEMSDEEKQAFRAGELLKPADIADAVLFILTRPKHVRIARMLITPASQAF